MMTTLTTRRDAEYLVSQLRFDAWGEMSSEQREAVVGQVWRTYGGRSYDQSGNEYEALGKQLSAWVDKQLSEVK